MADKSRSDHNQNMIDKDLMDRNLALEAVRVTEAAALAASRMVGRGDEKAADNTDQTTNLSNAQLGVLIRKHL